MNKKLALFIVITYAISWAAWLPILDKIESSPFESAPLVLLLFFIGAYSPTITAILLTAALEGKRGIKELFSRFRLKSVKKRWIIISLLVGPFIYSLAFVLYVLFDGSIGDVNYGLLPWLPIVFIVPIVFGPLAEEIGWRGYLLPILSPKSKPIQSSLLVGFIWALWHAPLFFAKSGTAISGFTITIPLVVLFFIAVIASSFIYTWAYNNTLGNLSIAIFIHLSMNSSGTIRGMLFPEMTLGESLQYYIYYTAVLCSVIIIGFIILRKKV
jgi:membrane protease YdiL (CAAX protease family)